MKQFISKSPNPRNTKDSMGLTPTNKGVLSSLFSKQFLVNVKDELNKKKVPLSKIPSRPSKEELEAHTHKCQIQMMSNQINILNKQNQFLKQKIKQIQQPSLKTIDSLITIDKSTSLSLVDGCKLKLIPRTIQLSVLSRKGQHRVGESRWKQRIEHLQRVKAIKDERISELLQKQIRYEGELRYRKRRQQNLQEQVKSLRETIKVQLSFIKEKPLKVSSNSDIELKLPLAVEESQDQNPLLHKIAQFLQIQKQEDQNLLNSCCANVQVPEEMHLSKLEMKNEFNDRQLKEIDQLIQVELPHVHISQDLEHKNSNQKGCFAGQIPAIELANSQLYLNQNGIINNLNDSVVKIDINEQTKIKPQINQSMVTINI